MYWLLKKEMGLYYLIVIVRQEFAAFNWFIIHFVSYQSWFEVWVDLFAACLLIIETPLQISFCTGIFCRSFSASLKCPRMDNEGIGWSFGISCKAFSSKQLDGRIFEFLTLWLWFKVIHHPAVVYGHRPGSRPVGEGELRWWHGCWWIALNLIIDLN